MLRLAWQSAHRKWRLFINEWRLLSDSATRIRETQRAWTKRARVQTVVKAIEPRATGGSLFLSLYFSLPLSLFLPRRGRFLKAHSLMSRIAGIVLPLRRGAEFFPPPTTFFFLLLFFLSFFLFSFFHFNLACPRTYGFFGPLLRTYYLVSTSHPSFYVAPPSFHGVMGRPTPPSLSLSLSLCLFLALLLLMATALNLTRGKPHRGISENNDFRNYWPSGQGDSNRSFFFFFFLLL